MQTHVSPALNSVQLQLNALHGRIIPPHQISGPSLRKFAQDLEGYKASYAQLVDNIFYQANVAAAPTGQAPQMNHLDWPAPVSYPPSMSDAQIIATMSKSLLAFEKTLGLALLWMGTAVVQAAAHLT